MYLADRRGTIMMGLQLSKMWNIENFVIKLSLAREVGAVCGGTALPTIYRVRSYQIDCIILTPNI